jgi:hypothetical protein
MVLEQSDFVLVLWRLASQAGSILLISVNFGFRMVAIRF